MKKWMMMLLSILLIAAMAMSFAACGSSDKDDDDDKNDKKSSSSKKDYDENSIVGEWEGIIDYTEMLNLGFEVTAKISWEFYEDGTYDAVISLSSMIDSLEANGGEILEEQAASANMSVSDFLEYMEISMGGSDTETEGEYEFENGNLILDGSDIDCQYTGAKMTLDLEGLPVSLERK